MKNTRFDENWLLKKHKRRSRTVIYLEIVRRAVAQLADNFHSTFAVTRVLFVTFVRRRIVLHKNRPSTSHVTVAIIVVETIKRTVGQHLFYSDSYPRNSVEHRVHFVRGRHVWKIFGCVHHYLDMCKYNTY